MGCVRFTTAIPNCSTSYRQSACPSSMGSPRNGYGGADGDRTRDLDTASAALSQPSYCPNGMVVTGVPHSMRPASCQLSLLLAVGIVAGWAAPADAAHVNVIELDNQIISPITQQYIEEAISRSETDAAVCLVILLDTPGGLLESTRAIVKRIMNAKVPVAVYVAPSGSRAGSAGVFITLAGHVAAMAPSTNIGAAHPVAVGEGGGPVKRLIKRVRRDAKRAEDVEEEVTEEADDPMSEKIMNDTVAWITTIAKTRGRNEAWAVKAVTESVSVTEAEAVREHIVDLVAADLPDLLRQIDGRTVTLVGVKVALATKDAQLVRIPMTARQRFLAVITNPNIAYLLMMLGTLGLIFEFTHPGVGFPGIAGLMCVLLALYAFQALPISYVAVALLVLGLGLLVAELFVTSFGLLAVGAVITPTVATLAAIVLFVLQRAVKAQRSRVTTGPQGLLGERGTASTDLTPNGTVFVHGELWNATGSQPIRKGDPVRVVKVDGLQLFVEKVA